MHWGIMKPETRFRKNQVLPFLRTLPQTAVFPIQQRTIRGDPDFILCSGGRFVALELKAAGESLRKLQAYKEAWVKSKRGIWLTAEPGNWAHIRNVLTLIDKGED